MQYYIMLGDQLGPAGPENRNSRNLRIGLSLLFFVIKK
jgi:hypothetical protein